MASKIHSKSGGGDDSSALPTLAFPEEASKALSLILLSRLNTFDVPGDVPSADTLTALLRGLPSEFSAAVEYLARRKHFGQFGWCGSDFGGFFVGFVDPASGRPLLAAHSRWKHEEHWEH